MRAGPIKAQDSTDARAPVCAMRGAWPFGDAIDLVVPFLNPFLFTLRFHKCAQVNVKV
jgi:hypothetical protein